MMLVLQQLKFKKRKKRKKFKKKKAPTKVELATIWSPIMVTDHATTEVTNKYGGN